MDDSPPPAPNRLLLPVPSTRCRSCSSSAPPVWAGHPAPWPPTRRVPEECFPVLLFLPIFPVRAPCERCLLAPIDVTSPGAVTSQPAIWRRSKPKLIGSDRAGLLLASRLKTPWSLHPRCRNFCGSADSCTTPCHPSAPCNLPPSQTWPGRAHRPAAAIGPLCAAPASAAQD